jgi:hypothetical protein
MLQECKEGKMFRGALPVRREDGAAVLLCGCFPVGPFDSRSEALFMVNEKWTPACKIALDALGAAIADDADLSGAVRIRVALVLLVLTDEGDILVAASATRTHEHSDAQGFRFAVPFNR